MTLQFSEFYNSYSKNSLENGDKIFFKPNIPPKKLANAIKAYAPHVSEEDVYILADETFWGKADNGLLVTNTEIITNDPSDKIYNIKLDNVGGFAFGGILGGNFILNGHKLIVFTQLLKNDKNKLSACLNAFLEKKARVEQAIVIQKKEEEKEQLIEKLDSVLLSEIISSRDKNLIGTFIEANDLTPLKRIKATIHDRPDLFLNNENGLGFRRILERTSIDSSAVKNVIELMYEVFSLAEILDELQKNEVFEILMVQNKVIATIFIAMKTITCGYLKTILDYMPSERSLEIVQRYESAFNIIISQLLMALALNKNLGEVLRKTQSLMELDPDSDEYLVENNRLNKMLQQANKDIVMDMLVRGIREELDKDLHEIEISNEGAEEYNFIHVIQAGSAAARIFIYQALNQMEDADLEDIEDEVDTVFIYLQNIIKDKFNSIYL